MNKYIEKEIKIYSEIYQINLDILKILNNKKIDEEGLKLLIEKRESLIKELKQIENILEIVWNNWKKFSSKVKVEKVKILRELLEKNIALEKNIIEIYEKRLNSIKNHLKKFDKGSKALSGYKVVKVNIPVFKSFKV